jgi:YD repeat-containing protein
MGESGFDGMSHFLNIFVYDPAGKLSEIKYTTDKIVTEKRVFKYFDNKAELNILSPTNTILSKELTSYDTKENILEELKYIQGNVSQKFNYQYNINDKKIEETKVNFGNFSYRKKYVYENDGKLLQIIEETPENQTYIPFEYKYDSHGNVIEERWTKDSSSEYSRKKHTYDSKDLLIETDFFSASYNFSVLYKYTYQTY